MNEIKRAIVVVKAGRPDFAEAMASGIMTAKSRRLTDAEREAVEAEIDRQKIHASLQRSLLRVAVGNTKTADDYAAMRCDAEIEYGAPLYEDGPLRRAARKLMGVYGLLLVGIASAYKAQEKVLRGQA